MENNDKQIRAGTKLLDNILYLLDRQTQKKLAPNELLGFLGLLNLISIINYINPQGQLSDLSHKKKSGDLLQNTLQNVLGENEGSGLSLGEVLGEVKRNPEMLGNMLNLVSSMKSLSEKAATSKKQLNSSKTLNRSPSHEKEE